MVSCVIFIVSLAFEGNGETVGGQPQDVPPPKIPTIVKTKTREVSVVTHRGWTKRVGQLTKANRFYRLAASLRR